MKAKRKDLMNLWKFIEKGRGTTFNVKFSYFLAKNRKAIQPEIEKLNEKLEMSEAFKIYDTARGEIAKAFSDKDDEGNPVIKDSNYIITEGLEEFKKVVDKLKLKHKEAVDERKKNDDRYYEMLDEEVEFNGYTIKLTDLPAEIEVVSIEIFMNVDLLDE